MILVKKYWLKNLRYLLHLDRYGYYQHLKSYRNPNYNHERDKHPVRQRHNQYTGWKNSYTRIRRRDYQNYQEYVTHQAQKFTEILQMHGGFSHWTILTWRHRFYNRFKHLVPLLPKDAVIICLGARQGTEVEVLRDLGFSKAYGIDLNPGPDNPYVVPGDFMRLQEADQSVDCVYTNSVDHAFDLDAFLAEQQRVLKPSGYAIYDLPRYSGSRNPGAFEAIGWKSEEEIVSRLRQSFKTVIRTETEKKWQWILLQGPHTDRW